MSSMCPVLLILGAGSNVGASVAKAFAAKGYKVALASRKDNEEDSSLQHFHISCDLSDPASVPEVFAKVKETLGMPSVVVYNGTKSPPVLDEPNMTILKLLLRPEPISRILFPCHCPSSTWP